MPKGERLALDNQGKCVAGYEGMMIACVSTNMSTVKSRDGHMSWRSCPTVPSGPLPLATSASPENTND